MTNLQMIRKMSAGELADLMFQFTENGWCDDCCGLRKECVDYRTEHGKYPCKDGFHKWLNEEAKGGVYNPGLGCFTTCEIR